MARMDDGDTFVDIVENGVTSTYVVYEDTNLPELHTRWQAWVKAAKPGKDVFTFGQFLDFNGHAEPVTAEDTFEVVTPERRS